MKRRAPTAQRDTSAVAWALKAEEQTRQAKQPQLAQDLLDRQRMLECSDRRIAGLEHRLSLLEAQLHSIQTSKSWRLTRPLRVLFETLRLRKKTQAVSDSSGIPAEEISEPPALDYQRWVSLYGRLDSADRQDISKQILRLSHKPLVTIVMQCFDTKEELVDTSVASLRGQLYPNWELLLFAAPSGHSDETHQKDGTTDPRIRLFPFGARQDQGRGGFTEAVREARGDYVIFLCPGDVLDERALFAVAKTVDADPEIGLLYADEDKLDDRGERTAPVFKPDWSLDLFHSYNFLTGLIAYKTSLLHPFGDFEEQSSNLWAYDLHLRLAEALPAHDIRHLPSVLYHRRQQPRSTRDTESEKRLREATEIDALRAYFERQGVDARIHIDRPRKSRCISYGIGANPPLVSVVVTTKDRVDLLGCCVEGLLNATDYPALELLVVDNQSQEAETFRFFDQIDRDPRVRILQYPHPYNFSAINNYAVSHSSGELVALVNCDIEFTKPDWLAIMAGHALRPEIGAVGPLLLYPSGVIQSAGVILGVGGVAANRLRGRRVTDPFYDGRPLATRNISAVAGALLLLRRAVFDEVGGLDERLVVAFNDIDLCLKIYESGYLNLWTAQAVAIHHESQLLKRHDSPKRATQFGSEASFMQTRWGHLLAADPFYNRNLGLEVDHDFELACPPRAPTSPYTYSTDSTG